MNKFSRSSKERLTQCNPVLVDIFNEVIRHVDCSVLCGHRGEDEQNLLYSQGKSKLQYPNSKHNSYPSNAVDVVPYPVNWDDKERFIRFASFVQGVAVGMGYSLRWGGSWSVDPSANVADFFDAVHFEVVYE